MTGWACGLLVVGDGRAAAAAARAGARCGAETVLLGGVGAIPRLSGEHGPPGRVPAFPAVTSRPGVDSGGSQTARTEPWHYVDCRDTPGDDVLGGVTVVPGVVWGVFGPGEVAALVGGERVVFRPRALVLAPRLRPVVLPVAGWGLPGVVGLDGLEAVRGRVVLAGVGLGRAARMLAARGCRVVRVAGAVRCEGVGRFEALLLADGRRIEADWCVLHAGWAPDAAMARALAVPCRDGGDGVLLPEVDAFGGTVRAGVFVAACGSGGGGRAAGYAAARWLGLRAPWVRRRDRAVGLRRVRQAVGDAEVVCPCEGVTAGRVRRALAAGAASVPAVKRATRAGMGVCQGRRCGPVLWRLCGGVGEAGQVVPRAPLVPVRAGVLAERAEVVAVPLAAPVVTRWTTVPAVVPPGGAEVVVVGAGVVGLSAALHLARAGRDVVVVDRGEPGLGASTANAGSLHVQLLPQDVDGGDAGPLGEALALGPASIALWREIAAEAGEDLGIRTEGGLVLAADGAELEALERKAAFERGRGVETRVLRREALAALAPEISRGYAGAAFCAAEGQMDPLRGMAALLRLVRQAGIRVVAGVEVLGLEREAGWGVRCAGGVMRAGQVLNAAGAHAGPVAGLAGVGLPVRAVVQQVIATAPAPPLLRQLVAQVGTRLSLKQGAGGHLLIGGGWPGRQDADGATRLLRRSIEGNLWTAIQALPALAGVEVVRAWTGLTTHLDRGPVVSGTPGLPGLFHAVTANGLTLGPAVGRMVAEGMLGRAALPGAFALGR